MTNPKTIFSVTAAVSAGSAEEYCKVCGSWKLGTIGIGIDLVEEKIRDKYPDISLFRIDSDATPDEKRFTKRLRNFGQSPARFSSAQR
jgi:primosomal protein N'